MQVSYGTVEVPVDLQGGGVGQCHGYGRDRLYVTDVVLPSLLPLL